MTRTPDDVVNSYIADMLALENHIDIALRAQIAGWRDEYPIFTAQLDTIHRSVRRHVHALKGLSDDRDTGTGGAVAEVVKRTGYEDLPKALGDDYTALSLAAIGYVRLLAAARAFGDSRVADLAEQHLKDHTEAATTLRQTIPLAVVTSLQQDRLPAQAEVLPAVGRVLDEIWHTGAREVEVVGNSLR
jgi:hypothetical protein